MGLRLPFDGNWPITQTFGNDLVINGVHIYAQYGLKGHNGLDYGIPTGNNILAPHRGKILEAYFDATGYGWYVKIENDVEGSVLGHMLNLLVKIGDDVEAGQRIGISDNTGNSTGAHLHWGYYRFPRNKTNGFNGYIDQTSYISASPSVPALNYGDAIMAYLKSVGYSYPESHLEVIKALYQSDLALKSGIYITRDEAQKTTDLKLKEAIDLCEKEKAAKVEAAVNEKLKVLEVGYQEYVKVKDSRAYKLALLLSTLPFFRG